MDINVSLPANGWRPRAYQMPAWDALERGCKRALLFWHRRAGKDDICLHWAASAAFLRVGVYWHMLPEASQARKAIWDAVNPHTGKRRIDEAFPLELRAVTRENEMFIRFVNGSTWQVIGSDNFNSLVGSPPVGLVASEWALSKPQAWAYLRPILAENGGWALFITTPRGKNHAYRMLQGMRGAEGWYTEVLSALKTDVFTPQQLLREQSELIAEHGEAIGRAMYRQEYMCEFDAPVIGAVYPEELQAARDEGRILRVPHDPKLPVSTYWDLGYGDTNCIWFAQRLRGEVRVIDYLEGNKKGLDHYAREIGQRKYNYAEHWLPHDGASGDVRSGKSAVDVLKPLVPGKVKVTPRLSVEQGVKLVRALLPRCVFDEMKTADGFDGLVNYRRDVNKQTAEERAEFVHDWASHPADAFRTMAVAMDEEKRPAEASPDDWIKRRGTEAGWMAA